MTQRKNTISHSINKGDKFGTLTFTGEFENVDRRWHGLFDCDCGRIKSIRVDRVVKGETLSCGCSGTSGHYMEKRKKYAEDYPFYVIWMRIKKSALKKGKEFTITLYDIKDCWIKQNGQCRFSKIKLELPKQHKDLDKPLIISIDRIDSSIGYVPGNIQIVHKLVNIMKQCQTDEQFINNCKLISARFEVNNENI